MALKPIERRPNTIFVLGKLCGGKGEQPVTHLGTY